MSDDLARRIALGDTASFEALFRALHAPLCEVVDSYVQSQAVAEELVQDLFFAVWMRRAELRDTALRGYLFAAARNRALHHLRRQSLARRWSAMVESLPDLALVGRADAADARLAGEEVRRAVDSLPPRSRLAIVLRMDHGMSHTEIGEAMGISVKGVEKLLAAGRRRLKALLDPMDPSELPSARSGRSTP